MNKQLSLLFIWLILAVTAFLVLRNTTITHDLTQFLPKGASKQQKLVVNLVRTGPTNRLILIALENATIEELASTSRRMANLLDQSGQFSLVSNGAQITTKNLAPIFRYRYLLDPNTKTSSFSEQFLHRALQQRLDELASALPLTDSKHLAADPTAAFRSVVSSWKSSQQQYLQNGVWFTPDDQRALLVATTKASGFDSEAQQLALNAIHKAFTDSAAAENTRLLLSGAPVFADNARNTIRSNLRTLSIAASITVVIFLLFAYRSLYFLILGGIPILSSLIVGSITTYIIFGNIHGITLVFGITLLGVAIDYPIHLFSHLNPAKTPKQTILHIWPTLRLGVITTCIGYLAFARQDFTGLAQLGIFTTSGLLAAAAITRWFLPSLILTNNVRSIGYDLTIKLDSLMHLPLRFSRYALVASVTLLALLLSISSPDWESDLSALSPITNEQRELDTSLRNAIGAPDVSQLIVVRGADPDSVLRISEQVTSKLQLAIEQGLLSDFDAPTRYLPSTVTQQLRQASLPDTETTNQVLTSAMQGLPFKHDAFKPFLNALSESRVLPPLTLADVENTPIGMRIQSLIFSDNQEWNALILLSGITSHPDFQSWWSQQKLTDAQLINLKETSSNLLTDFRNSTLERLLLGITIILIILSIGLRSPTRAIRVLLPVVLAISLTIAFLGLIGERLSLFHLIALLLSAGIGIDYSLFFHKRAIQDTGQLYIAHALLVCAISTVTVFGILATSPIPVLHAIGLTVSISIPLCFFLALVSANAGKGKIQDGEAKVREIG